jgi:hypothetical protein
MNGLISANFTWKDALWLPSWNRMATVEDGLTEQVKSELVNIFNKLEIVRGFLGNRPVFVHCAFRPKEYNKEIGGAPVSAHIEGKAIDYHVKGMSCDQVRKALVFHLDTLKIRMEDKPGSNWVHNDSRDSKVRFFKP